VLTKFFVAPPRKSENTFARRRSPSNLESVTVARPTWRQSGDDCPIKGASSLHRESVHQLTRPAGPLRCLVQRRRTHRPLLVLVVSGCPQQQQTTSNTRKARSIVPSSYCAGKILGSLQRPSEEASLVCRRIVGFCRLGKNDTKCRQK